MCRKCAFLYLLLRGVILTVESRLILAYEGCQALEEIVVIALNEPFRRGGIHS
jgi:hypothetical protein